MEDYPGFHERMSRLREMEIGLDGAICAGDGEVRVHLSYMAACNQTLFNRITGFMKQGQNELKANKMSLKGIQRIVDYCYTGGIEITEVDFEHIIDAALGLEFLNIVEQCVQFALTSNVNSNIWCHFLRAAFKHPRSVQPNSFVPDLILHNIQEIPREAVIQGLDVAYIGEILEHGTCDNGNRSYVLNVFLEMISGDNAKMLRNKKTLIRMRDVTQPKDILVIPAVFPDTTVSSIMDLALDINFPALAKACVIHFEKALPTASSISQMVSWMKQYPGFERETYLDQLCLHAFRNLPMDTTEVDMSFILASNSLGTIREFDIFESLVKWIEHNNTSVETNRKLVTGIRFGLMTKEEMFSVIRNHDIPGCERILLFAVRHHICPLSQPLSTGDMNRMRLIRPLVYVIGGRDAVNNINKAVLSFEGTVNKDGQSVAAFVEKEQTPFALYSSACAMLNGFLFVSGGKSESETTNTLFRFDCRQNIWLELEQMGQRRAFHTLTLVDTGLIAVGGLDDASDMRGTEVFDIKRNIWTCIEPLPEGRNQHAASCVDGILYITGGSGANTLFALTDNTWNELSPMLHVRRGHEMTGISGMLFVTGGAAKTEVKHADVMSTEGYDIIQDQWTELCPPKLTCGFGCSVIMNDWFYTFGGYSESQKSTLDNVQRYNIETNEWEICEIKLPQKLYYIVGACVPRD